MTTQNNYASRVSAAALCSAFMGLVVAIGIVAVALSEHKPGLTRHISLLMPLLDTGQDAGEGDLAL